MYFKLDIEKSGRWFAISCDCLGVFTQGNSVEEAKEMFKDALNALVEEGKSKAQIEFADDNQGFKIVNFDEMIAFIMERLRHQSELSIADLADELGQKSKSLIHRYLQGKSIPTITRFDELINAMGHKIFIA